MSHRRKREENHRLKKLYEETKNGYGRGAWYSDKKQRYVRYYAYSTTGLTKQLRRTSNKKVRNSDDVPMRGSGYKKCYDYWWILF